jgi:hypothetical protein
MLRLDKDRDSTATPQKLSSSRSVATKDARLFLENAAFQKMPIFRIAGDTPAKAVCAQKRAENGLLAALNRAFVFTNRYIAMPGRTDSIQVAG